MGILVFDVGTSSMRGVLMNEQADILCQFQEKYHPDFHLSIYVTQNPEIWRSPGKIQVCVLSEDLSTIDKEHPLQFEVLKEGLLKNHGYCKAEVDGVLRSYVAANEGVFECTPPESAEGTWEIKQVLDEASSDIAFADFDNDGELEMLTISPLHKQWRRLYFVCKQRN